MPYDTEETQAAVVNGLNAIEHTKRGYGLWRGEVIHPASDMAAKAAESGEPITDTKGLGLRYVLVRGAMVLPHFRVHDPERFSAALDRAFPAVHDAIVRLVADDIRAGGFDALMRWCARSSLPEAFDLAGVFVEKPCDAGGVSYRPDIVAAHSEGGRIELEVVNTHAPGAARCEAAWQAGHLVLSLGVRDLVEQIVFSEGRDVVPDDALLRDMLRGRKFRLAGRERVGEAVLAVWRDLNLSAYAMSLRSYLRAAYQADAEDVQGPICEILNTVSGSDLDDRVKVRGPLRNLYDSFWVLWGGGWAAHDLEMFLERLERASRPHPLLAAASADVEGFLDEFDRAAREPVGVRRLRYCLAAVWHVRKMRLKAAAINAADILELDAANCVLNATEEGIS